MLSKFRPWWHKFSARKFKGAGKWITPNQLSVLNLIFGTIAAYLIFIDRYIWAVVFITLSGFGDWFDGAIARADQLGTPFGRVVDAVSDRFVDGFIFLGMLPADWLAMPALIITNVVSHVGVKEPNASKGLLERPERLILISLALLFNQLRWGLITIIVLSSITLFMRMNSARLIYKK
ncbi:MAG: CDP-alcohol phosphatidyltransferase family protein [Candidatus Altiarchaeota archaeon]|nr:CDP-alcohol phosphatidyltransferase family protein [Candidatus Altiarchaeota archaeon]